MEEIGIALDLVIFLWYSVSPCTVFCLFLTASIDTFVVPFGFNLLCYWKIVHLITHEGTQANFFFLSKMTRKENRRVSRLVMEVVGIVSNDDLRVDALRLFELGGALDCPHRLFPVDVVALDDAVVAVRAELLLARQDALVVAHVSGEVVVFLGPRAHDEVQVPVEMSRSIDDVQRAIAKVVQRRFERSAWLPHGVRDRG
jgi:hypothetical protein